MFNFILYKIGQFLALSLPLKLTYRLAVFIAAIKCFISPRDRRAVANNLRIITKENNQKILNKYAYQVYGNFAKYLVDFFRFSKIDDEYIKKYIKLDNLDYVDTILKKGKGMIILTAHLGNWELGGVVMPKLGYSVNAIALNHKETSVNNFFLKQRSIGGAKFIPLGASVRKAFECLSRNEILAILADRDFSKSGLLVNFFGKKSIIPKGPAILSLKLGSPIVPCFMIREKDDTFRFLFGPAVMFSSSGNMDEDVTALTQTCIKTLEKYIVQYPNQWYMFKKFWED